MNFLMRNWTNLLASRKKYRKDLWDCFAVFRSQDYFLSQWGSLQLQIVIIAFLSPVVAAECTRITGQVPWRDGAWWDTGGTVVDMAMLEGDAGNGETSDGIS